MKEALLLLLLHLPNLHPAPQIPHERLRLLNLLPILTELVSILGRLRPILIDKFPSGQPHPSFTRRLRNTGILILLFEAHLHPPSGLLLIIQFFKHEPNLQENCRIRGCVCRGYEGAFVGFYGFAGTVHSVEAAAHCLPHLRIVGAETSSALKVEEGVVVHF